jgi:RimJ/RimL family protein N-acetyltransferase
MATDIPTIETEQLVMRAFTNADTDAFAALCADDEVMRWLGGTMDRNRAWRHMATLVGHWRLHGFGRWALELRETGELVGHVGLWFPEGWPAIEVGWVVARQAWGRGIAPEAARATLDYAWDEAGLDRVIHLIDPVNERSQSVARKIGSRPTDERFDFAGKQLTIWEKLRPRA